MKILSFILPHIVANKAKGRIQKGCLKKKTKHTEFSGKQTFLTPLYAHDFYTPWKRQKTFRFSDVFREYKNGAGIRG